jgi:DNA-binding response OmpR family regulator
MTRILCVDDNVELAELLVEILNLEQYETKAAFSGEECLCLLRTGSFHPDLILLDIMMEPMDGWETLRNIRKDTRCTEVPVVMLTGKHPTMHEAETYCEMIADYLMKPYTPRQLLDEIEYILDRTNHLRTVEKKAKEQGIDRSLILNYRKLASTVETLKRLREIIGDVEPFREELLDAKEQQFIHVKTTLSAAGVED